MTHQATILDFEEKYNKRSFERTLKQMQEAFVDTTMALNEYAKLMRIDKNQAIEIIDEYLARIRGSPKKRVYEAYGGGPDHRQLAPVLAIVGEVYPFLEKPTRTIALRKCITYLDTMRSDYATNHVSSITEPWLIGDIHLNRWVYLPSFESCATALKENKNYSQLAIQFPNLNLAFLAYVILLQEYSSGEVRKEFYKRFPELIDRTLDFAAVRVNNYAKEKELREGISLEDTIGSQLTSCFHWTTHERIRKKIREEKWIKL